MAASEPARRPDASARASSPRRPACGVPLSLCCGSHECRTKAIVNVCIYPPSCVLHSYRAGPLAA
eukprot:3438764-Prymnesium_polylepis.1